MHLDKLPLPSRAVLNRVGIPLGCLGLVLSVLALLFPGRVIVQARHEQSISFRLGLRFPAPAQWHAGELVEFITRDLSPYYPPGTVFTKIVAAIPGDHLRLDGRIFSVNGVIVGTARTTDSQGRPAPRYIPLPGPDGQCAGATGTSALRTSVECTLPHGTLFVLGTHERSFDSRYWGLVESSEVTGRVVPLW